jgi:hypothetical protein
MRHPKMIGYVVGCIGVLTVGAALAKDPVQTVGPSSSVATPAGCTDSARGRTHVLRFCGERHYWLKTAAARLAPGGLVPATVAFSTTGASVPGNGIGSTAGGSNNWGGFQR